MRITVLKHPIPAAVSGGWYQLIRVNTRRHLMVLEALQLWVEFLFGSLFDKNKEKQALLSISTRKQSLPNSLGAGYLS